MTKKLSEFEKQNNKTRRHMLIEIKKLLKNKRTAINWNMDHEMGRRRDGSPYHTGNNKLVIEWQTKLPLRSKK